MSKEARTTSLNTFCTLGIAYSPPTQVNAGGWCACCVCSDCGMVVTWLKDRVSLHVPAELLSGRGAGPRAAVSGVSSAHRTIKPLKCTTGRQA